MKPKNQNYHGHRIELIDTNGKMKLLIDGIPFQYGQLSNGLYFLHNHAYEWSEDLMILAKKIVDYQDNIDKMRNERSSGKGRGE